MAEAAPPLPRSHRFTRQVFTRQVFTRHVLRDIGISLITTLTATAIWSAMPVHQEKVAMRAEPVTISSSATNEDLATAAQFEQIALSKLAPLKSEADLMVSPAKQQSAALSPIVAKPVHKSLKPQILAQTTLPVPLARPNDLVLPVSADAGMEPLAIIAPPPVKPSLLERMVSQVPGHDQLAAGVDATVGATADFVSWMTPKFKW